ncbi:RNA polymerase subunit sigma [Streptomyces sp. NBC_00445]|uniref:RNA polymerase subunit sigma n=1 Tax=Streptomyces sp. NBC_00445 TaxID=2975745 RepID=UPI002E1A76F3
MDDVGAVPIGELVEERRYLLDVAYWMLGSAGAAEAVVGDAYRRWYGLSDTARAEIVVPRLWLARTVGGICLGRLASPGRHATSLSPTGLSATGLRTVGRQDEGDRGPGRGTGAGAGSEGAQQGLGAEISRVLLSALDSLSPAERAAFVLSDVFGMAPGAVADIVGRGEPECAELADRARHSLRLRRSRSTSPSDHDALARAVREACVSGDAELLASLLCRDVTAFFDGGGKVRALARPVHGSRRVARSLLTLLAQRPRTTLATHPVNGAIGLVARYGREVAAVISLGVADHQVVQVWVVLNPDKLRPWNHPTSHGAPGPHQSP